MWQLFDRVRSEQPGALDKVVVLAGDCGEPGLGLSDDSRRLLQDQVSYVYHCAANVRFDQPAQKAVFLNLRSTRDAVELARSTKQLKVGHKATATWARLIGSCFAIGRQLTRPMRRNRTKVCLHSAAK